ncbi:unnamed protein product [Clavelina lepadiformis]|uniref:G-protein coupled receptors family 1 profile domain-containing protein n=2 Tax=Clavelina lepadiformis TaxID=159417 RepID=A0ABP0FVK2_CLALP
MYLYITTTEENWFGNATSIPLKEESASHAVPASTVIVAIVLMVITTGSALGNMLVLWAIKKDKSLHSPANFLIGSLAITDLLVAFLIMPFSALYEILDTWVFGDVFCQIWTATDIACCTASILHLCVIALERHQSISNAVRYFSERRRHTVAPKVMVVWILAMCISVPPILGWKPSSTFEFRNLVIEPERNHTYEKPQCKVGHDPGYTVYATLGSFYIPLILLLVVYGRIYFNIRKYVKRTQSRSKLSSVRSEESFSLRWKDSTNKRASLLQSKKSSQCGVSVTENSPKFKPTNRSEDLQCHVSNLTFNAPPVSLPGSHKSIPKSKQLGRKYAMGEISLEQKTDNITSAKTTNSVFTGATIHGRKRKLCRQGAVDHLFPIAEGSYHSNVRHSVPQQDEFKSKCTSPDFLRRKSVSNNRPTRRYSEGDLSPNDFRACVTRPRTQTTGGRVRFLDDIKLSQKRAISKLASNSFKSDVTNTTLSEIEMFDERRLRLTRKTSPRSNRFNSRNRHQHIQYKKISTCCFFWQKKTAGSIHQQHLLQQSSISPMLRYSLSLRSKIKVLKAREIRAIRTLGTIVGAFVLCWLPFFVITLAVPFCTCVIPRPLKSVVLWLGYCNSFLNPIIYGAFNREFHAAFKKIVGKPLTVFCKRNSNSYEI